MSIAHIFDDTRDDWNARPPKNGGHRYVGPGAKVGVAGHWAGNLTGILESDPHDRCLSRVRAWQDWHMDGQGWRDLGYHILVCVHGRVIEGAAGGPYTSAAHVQGANTGWIGLQFMRGRDSDTIERLNDAMKDAGVRVFNALVEDAGKGFRREGHRDLWVNADGDPLTTCPGSEIEEWWTAPTLEGGQDMDEATLRRIIREEVSTVDLTEEQRLNLYGKVEGTPSTWNLARKAVGWLVGQVALIRNRQADHRRENEEQTAALMAMIGTVTAAQGLDAAQVQDAINGALSDLKVVRAVEVEPVEEPAP